MKNMIFSLLAATITLVGISASAVTIVSYGQWTSLPNCGGSTRLTCPDTDNARERNLCKIEFDSSYNCPTINLYTNEKFEPKGATVTESMDQSFFVDNSKVNRSGTFRVFMHNGDNSSYDQVTYEFSY